MQQHVAVITLPVSHLARSLAFYRGLGWQPCFDNDEVAFFQCNGLVLALWLASALAADLQQPVTTGTRGFTLAHNVRSRQEVDAVLAEAVAAGATTVRPARALEWGGYGAYFADPDGHVWEVAHNPFWELSPEGATRFKPAS